MKTIIMDVTIKLLCKNENEFIKLLSEGYEIKKIGICEYLIKEL